MYALAVVYRNITRTDAHIADRLANFGSATVHEAMGRVGLLKPCMRPIYAGAQVSGTAVTVLLHPGDNWMMHVVAEQIRPGDIVVAAVTAEPIFLSYPVPKAVSPRFGLGAQANIRSTM